MERHGDVMESCGDVLESHKEVLREPQSCEKRTLEMQQRAHNYETSSAGPVLCTLGSGIPRSHSSVAALALQLPGELQHRCF